MIKDIKSYASSLIPLTLASLGLGGVSFLQKTLPVIEIQAWGLRGIILSIAIYSGFSHTLSAEIREKIKPLLSLVFIGCFLLCVFPLIGELEFYYGLFLKFYSQTSSFWKASSQLEKVIEKIAPHMTLSWITWGSLAGGSLLLNIVTFPLFVLKPLKDRQTNKRITNGPWKSGFMASSHIVDLKKNKTGIPLGRYKGSLLKYQSNSSKGWLGGHHAVFAGSRAGKGVSCVIPAILNHQGPVVCLDIKGENFAATKRYRESLGRKVIVLNPFCVIQESQDTYNPLNYIRRDHLFRDLYVVAEGIVKPELGMNAHFSDLVRDLLSAAIEVTLTFKEKPSLSDVMDMFSSSDFIEELIKWSQNPQEYGERPAKIATAFLAAGDKEQGSIITTLQRNTNWIASDEMKRFLSRSTFDLEDLLDDKVDVFIVVPMDIIKQQENYLRLFTNLILGTVIRQDGKRRVKKPILMVLDEFTRLGRLEKFLDIATVAAGCGIEAMFVAQDKGQVDHIWGREGAGTILGSCATVRVFGLGRTDSVTAHWVEDQIGSQTILTQSKQKRSSQQKESHSFNEHKDRVLSASEVQEMSPNEMLCFIRSHKMLKLDRLIYYSDKEYKKKADQNPLV